MNVPITQTMSDISNSTDLIQQGFGFGISDVAFVCITILVIGLMIFVLIKQTAKKECWGCNRLKNCENKIKEIERKMSINGFMDKQTFIDISAKIDKISEEIQCKKS